MRRKSYEERRLQKSWKDGTRFKCGNGHYLWLNFLHTHTHSGGEATMRFTDDGVAFASLSLPVPDIKLWSAACIRKRVWFQGKPNAPDRKTTVRTSMKRKSSAA